MDWWMAVFTAIGGAAGSVTTWFFGIKKQRVEVTSGEYENFKKFVDANREIIKDLKEQLLDLIQQNGVLREKVGNLEQEINELKKQFPCHDCPNR
jgi:thiamine kinase-like enzyme